MDRDNLAGYELLEKLGEGGMGAVYLAQDRRIGRTVAIKMVRSDRLSDGKARDRFIREARSIGGLNHPNIATLYDVALTSESPHIVMEYLPGGSLEERLRRGRLSLGEILGVATAVASGLAHAHLHNVVHRDLKPANILFSGEDVPKIIDFGLAHTGGGTELTGPGLVMGTADYMSPEQACGQPVDHRSDLFSFGVVLYQMASGRSPFRCDSIPATLHSIAYDSPPPMATIRPDFPASFTSLVDGLLEKRPENRPPLPLALSELRTIETAGSGATRTMAIASAPVSAARRRWILPGALLILAVLASSAWLTRDRWMPPRLPESRQLVVLPFENLSRDPSDQAFCDGVVELLTSSLTQMERFHRTLWVIPSADVRRLQLHSVGEARKAFPVNLAVSGSLQSDGDRILVVVNLSDAASLRQIASRIVPISRSERSHLTTLLTSALLNLLDLSGGDAPGGPKTPAANDAYVQAKGLLLRAEVPANLNRAIELLELSLKQEPNLAASQATLGEAYLRRYQATKDSEWLVKADLVVQRSLEINPDETEAHNTLGRLYRATGEPDKAQAEFQKAIALDPTNVSAYTNLASAYIALRRPGDAENAYSQATRIRPSYFPAYTNLGIFYMNRGEYEKAIQPLSLVVKLAPESADGHTNLGTLYYFTNRFDDALNEFGKSLALRPNTTAYSNSGAIYHFKGDYARAREEYRHAIDLDGNNPLWWGNLADAEVQIPGSEAAARESYLKAIALSRQQLLVNPLDANLLGRMAFYLARTSGCTEARGRMKESLRIAPDRLPLIFKAAKVSEACQDRRSSLAYLEQAMKKGYSIREIEADPDLRALRATEAYATMRSSVTNKNR